MSQTMRNVTIRQILKENQANDDNNKVDGVELSTVCAWWKGPTCTHFPHALDPHLLNLPPLLHHPDSSSLLGAS